jgi:hypothetical protein
MAMQQPFESESEPESASPSPYAGDLRPRLESEHIDRLLAEPVPERASAESRNPPPMQGIWLGVLLGLVLWAGLAGIVALARLF